jgi:predicted HTH transcriptional regulator
MANLGNTAETSREAYRDLLQSGIIASQQERALQCIRAHGPLTRRELSLITKIEISALCRNIANLIQEGKVRVAFEGPCPITSRRSKHYIAVTTITPTKPLIQLTFL